MVKDRLPELRRHCDFLLLNNQKDNEISISIADINSVEQQINDVLHEYSDIRDGINEIKANVKTMRGLVIEMTSSFKQPKNLTETLDNIREANLSLCHEMFNKMKKLELNLPWKDDFTTLARIKRTNFFCIRDDFLNAWREHEHFLVQYEDKVKKTLLRQAKIADPHLSEEETENLIANNTTSLFVGNILEETEVARQNLRELLVRHSELAKIERSITEVRDMFLRISTLIMEQSALVQVVEYHAQQATIRMDKGTEELEKARDNKIKTLKKKTCILILVAIILTVLIIILLFV